MHHVFLCFLCMCILCRVCSIHSLYTGPVGGLHTGMYARPHTLYTIPSPPSIFAAIVLLSLLRQITLLALCCEPSQCRQTHTLPLACWLVILEHFIASLLFNIRSTALHQQILSIITIQKCAINYDMVMLINSRLHI